MEMKDGQIGFLSKYALSRGIVEAQVRAPANGRVFMDGMAWWSFKIGRDVHATKEEAVAAAEEAKKKKIASLQKQIKKIEALKF